MAFKSFTTCVAVAVVYFCRLAKSQDCDAEFTLQPEDVVAGAGDMAMMRCEYTSTSGTEVAQWDFEGTAIFAEDPPCGCSIEEDGTLHFSNITADDAGEYTCVVQSGFNTFRCSATLRLEEAPVISSQMGPGDVTFEHRELSVFVTGTPIPDVEWRHGGEVIDGTSARITTTSVLEGGGRRETLTISDIEADDRGLYTLHASNSAGNAEAQWTVLVIFGMVEEVEKDAIGSVIRLTCRGQVYSEVGDPEVSWLRAGKMVASEETTLSAQMFHTTFVTSLDVDMSTCMSNTEVVTCELMYVNAVGGEESIQKNTSVCDNCSSPEVAVSVKNCSDVIVDLKGNVGTLEYRSQDSSTWSPVSFQTSADTVTISDLDEDTVYIVRATVPCSPSAFATSSVTTHSGPPPVTGVNAVAIYNSSGIFITVTWEESSAAGLIGYHIKWSSEAASGTQELSPTTDHFGLAIVCNETYEFQVAAVNVCGRGNFSAPVQQMCDLCDGLVCGEGSECQIFEPTGEAFCNPNCEELNPCGPQQVCKLQPVNCVRAPCPPVLLCEDRVSVDVQLSESGVVVRVEAAGAESIGIIVRDSSNGRHMRKVVGSSASVEFPDLPSGLTSVRANVKLGRGNRVRTEWEEILIP